MQERILVSLFVFGFLYNFISFPVFPLPSRHGYDIRGYYDKGNFVVNLGCYFGLYLLVSAVLQ